MYFKWHGFLASSQIYRLVIGPPVGGALYDRFGYRGPFIFGISATGLDLIGRLIIIERKDAIRWGIDPASLKDDTTVAPPAENSFKEVTEVALTEKGDVSAPSKDDIHNESTLTSPVTPSSPDPESALPLARKKHLTLIDVLVQFGRSPRTLVACFLIFVHA